MSRQGSSREGWVAKLLLLYQFFCPRERNVGEWCAAVSSSTAAHAVTGPAALLGHCSCSVSLCTLEISGQPANIHHSISSDYYLHAIDKTQLSACVSP